MKRKSKFDADKYIDYNYVENEEAIISIYIEEQDDYYNEFDADELTLSDDIISFINSRTDNISNKYDIVLEFDSPIISEEEQNKIINIIRSHYGLASSSKNKILRNNEIKSLVFLVIGSLFLMLSYSASNFGDLVKEILSIAGWVAVWEAISILLFDTLKLKSIKAKTDRLFNARIQFVERK